MGDIQFYLLTSFILEIDKRHYSKELLIHFRNRKFTFAF